MRGKLDWLHRQVDKGQDGRVGPVRKGLVSLFWVYPNQLTRYPWGILYILFLVVTPLDVVKVRMQSQAKPVVDTLVFRGDFFDHLEPCSSKDCRLISPEGAAAMRRGVSPPLKGTLDGMRYIVETEGFHNLWRGLLPTLYLATIFMNNIYIFL